MLYLNKQLFKPALIVLSIPFGAALALFLILTITTFHVVALIAFLVLAVAYGVLIYLAWKISKAMKYYLTAGPGFLEIKYPTINYGRGKIKIPYESIVEFQYFPLNSIKSWKNLVNESAVPECIYIKYITKQGKCISELMGYVTYKEIKAIADQLKRKVVVMK